MTPQELKNSILQLAIQGKLVEQRAEEGTAAELLEKIARHGTHKTTGTHGTKSRAAHRASSVPSVSSVSSVPVVLPIPDDEKPFDIPESWEWVRLGDAFDIEMGQSPDGASVSEVAGGLEFHQGKIFFGEKYLKQSPQRTTAPTKIAEPNSVLLCVRAPVGKVNITSRRICIGRGLCSVLPLAGMDVDFVYYLLAAFETTFVRHATGTTFVAITGKVVKMFPIPLPPLAEQKRIVAKIEELLPLIDRYEKAWSKLEDFNKRFPVDMKKSLLQMAIQGKLVDHRLEEGTGEELYRQIQAEKQRLVKSGKIKKEKPLPEITEDEIPFEIPESWKWVRLGILCELVTSGSRDWAKFYSDTGDMFLRMGNLSRNSFKLRLDKIQHVKIPRTTEGQRTSLQAGDLLFSITGEVGTLGLIPEGFGKAYINQHTAMIRFLMSERNRYVPYLMLTDYAQKYYNGNQHGIKNSFRLDSIAFMPIPLPPLAEQKRIVAKLEELLPLCERLKELS